MNTQHVATWFLRTDYSQSQAAEAVMYIYIFNVYFQITFHRDYSKPQSNLAVFILFLYNENTKTIATNILATNPKIDHSIPVCRMLELRIVVVWNSGSFSLLLTLWSLLDHFNAHLFPALSFM